MASTASRNTDSRPGNRLALPVAAATLLYLGTIACIDANGRLVAGADADGLTLAGLVYEEADNSAGAAGDITGTTALGIYKFNNSATEALAAADVGTICYIEDNDTVAKTSTHKVKAGVFLGLDADGGAWVDMRALPLVTLADTITGAADLAALKVALVTILRANGIIK